MTQLKRYNVEEDIVTDFIFQSNYLNEKEMRDTIADWVMCDYVQLEDETDDQVVNYLIDRIYF